MKLVAALFALAVSPPGISVPVDSLTRLAVRRGPISSGVTTDYAWLDSETIVALRSGNLEGGEIVVSNAQGSREASGKVADMNALITKYMASVIKTDHIHFASGLLLSPDLQSILVFESRLSVGITRWHVMSLDGKGVTTVNAPPSIFVRSPVWRQDSQALDSLNYGPASAAIVEWKAVVATRKNNSTVGTRTVIEDWGNVARHYNGKIKLIGFTRQGTGVVTDWQPRSDAEISVIEVPPVGHNDRGTRFHQVRPPRLGRVDEIALSPDGSRLAWCIYAADVREVKDTSPWESAVEIWTSRIDGSEMRLIGSKHVKTLDPGEGLDVDAPEMIRWLPDGAYLSYECDNQLWVVPVSQQAKVG